MHGVTFASPARAAQRFVCFAISAAIVVMAGTIVTPAAKAQNAPVKIHLIGTDAQINQTPFFVAQKLGYFKDAGLDVSFAPLGGGAPAMAAALKSGQVDIAIAGALQHMQQIATNVISGKIIGVLDDTAGYEVLATNGISDVKGLKGKIFGISSYNGGDQYWAQGVLGKSGLTPDDVTWLPVGVPTARVAALTTGKIDATVIGVRQTGVPASAKDRIKAIANEENSGVPFVGGALFVRQEFLNTNKPALQRFLAALGKGSVWTREHPDEAIPACQETGAKAEDCKTNIAAQIAAKDTYTWSATTRVDADGIKAMLELYAPAITQFKGMKLEDFIDASVAGN